MATAPKSPQEATQTALEGAAGPGTGLTPIGAAQGAGGAVALPADLAAELAQEAKDEAARERPKLAKISLKGGMMTYMGQALPGERLDCVIVAVGYWRRYYEGKFDPNNTVNPTCFAIQSDPEEEMVPHENVEGPQHDTCKGCPKSQWKSAGEGRKGQACKESRRLVVMPSAALRTPEDVLKAEFAIIDLPVTSLANFANFVNGIAATVKRPLYNVLTTVSVHRHATYQFTVQFTPTATIDDPALIRALRQRREGAEIAATVPYDEAYLQGETRDMDVKSPTSGRIASKVTG